MLARFTPIRLLVAFVILTALLALGFAWIGREPFPGLLPLMGFLFVALLLESDQTSLRVQASGSTSFIIQLGAVLVFGAFWAALVAGISTAVMQVVQRKGATKIWFNTSQKILCILIASWVYVSLGGSLPPAFIVKGAGATDPLVKAHLTLFLVLAGTFFLVNSTLVSAAVALSTGRRFREVWYLNTRGVIGYDLFASLFAPVVAFAFSRWEGLGLLVAVLPIVAVRHFYGLYRQLQQSGQEMLAVMVKAIEARDPYTSGHSERVAQLSRAIALELGLPSAQVEEIATAALLHDVGKIHEEFAPLLRKEARLSAEETAVMQTHVLRSAELVGIVSKFRGRILEAVRHHHERWDGQGYPDGVVARAIPIGARIILVADTIDAMTTDRPYRKALSLDVVLAELQRCRATQFDPELVELVSNSVAVRRLISRAGNPLADSPDSSASPAASRRVPLSGAAFWKRREA